MGAIHVEKFGGQFPAWDARFLPDNQATASQNAFLYSGAAIGWRLPTLLHTLNLSTSKMAYRLPTISQGIAGANLSVNAPGIGDTVTVGEILYTFVATPTNPYDVLLGSSALASAQALFMAVSFGSYDLAIVGPNTPSNPAVAGDTPLLGFPYAFVGDQNTPGANTVILVPVTPTATMKLTNVNCVPQQTVPAANFKAVVYQNVNQINGAGTAYVNIPTTLIATGAQATGCTAGQTLTSALAVPITLQGGQTYWIGFIMDTAVPLSKSSESTSGVSNSSTYTSGPPNPFVTTTLSGVTTGGTSVGSLQTAYNLNQPNWQIWAVMAQLSSIDPINQIVSTLLELQAPAFGQAYNSTPVAENTGGTRLSWNGLTAFTGGANQTADTTITGPSTWMEWSDPDTNVVRSPVVNDTFQRYYFAAPNAPPGYNTYARIAAGQPPFYLGVPAPPIAPVVTISTPGGNPTQIGFPGSTTGNTYQFNGPTYQEPLVPGPGFITQFEPLLVVYPMKTSVESSLTAISYTLASLSATDQLLSTAFVFADNKGQPGDIVAQGAGLNLTRNNTGTFPYTATDTLVTPLELLANTQYWIGVVLNPGYPTTTVLFSLADNNTQGYSGNTQGYSGTIVPLGLTYNWPIDAQTGVQEAVPVSPNFVDLQLWGTLTAGIGAQEETRAYVYTWVTAYGEEGPPSPPALLDAYDNATWQVTMQPPLAEDMGTLRNIVQTNIYRTMASVQGGTVFFFVGSVSANATTFVDAFTDDVVVQNLILPSTTWFGPPATLQGMATMPNGMIAGFRGNEVWFCEPYRPHAWPAEYVMTTDFPIVGLGVVGNSLVACTETNPNVFIGTNPGVMSQVRVPLPEPCTSRGGILSTENGVYYPSINGMIKVSGAGYAANVTQDWITREKWDQLAPQKFVRATKNVSSYFAFGTTGVTNGQPDTSVAQKGFTVELSEVANTQSFTAWPQVGGHRIGFGILSAPNGVNIDNVLCDPWSGVTILVFGQSVWYYDFTNPAPAIQKYLWRSKKFENNHRDNYAAFRVWFDTPPGGPQTPPATRTTVPFKNPPPTTAQLAYAPGMLGVVRIIADGFYVTERELRYSTELMRVASQQKYTTWQIEIEGVVSVTGVKLATSVKELAKMGAVK